MLRRMHRLTGKVIGMTEAKRMLREIRISRIEIKALEEKRGLIEARATKVTRGLTGMPAAKNEKTDLSNSVVGLLELDRILSGRIEALARREKHAIEQISAMKSAKHRTLLTLYYIAGSRPHTWEEVSRKMGYSLSGIFKLHGQALLELQKILDNEKSVV